MKSYVVRESVSEKDRQNLAAFSEFESHLLYHRGIKTFGDAEIFFNPNWEAHTHDPFLLKGMDKAVERILKAIKNDERICIYSDYDSDGIPGAVVLHDFFKKIGFNNFENYIPHRHTEGFGVNTTSINSLGGSGIKLIITIDCGITDVEEVKRANEIGIDVVITDHHAPPKILPPAYAIIDQKQEDDTYPCDHLCGSGVIFKVVQALIIRMKENGTPLPTEGFEKWLLDMVGIATCADMVPLQGENRVFAYYGLKVLRKSPRPGLLKLCSALRLNQREIVEDDIGFTLAPRINAASRMGEPREAFDLLSTLDLGEAERLAKNLEKMNDARKGAMGSMVKEVKKAVHERSQDGGMRNVILCGNPSWQPALLGLVANSLVQEHARPVFLWGRDDGDFIKGSCRSDGSVSLLELMQCVPSGFFTDFGGHQMSGGFTMHQAQIHFLEEELLKAYEKVRQAENAEENIPVDKKLSLDDVSWKTWDTIAKFAPFGKGNPKPVFLIENAEIKGVKTFGKTANHLELLFANSRGQKISSISFFKIPADFSVPIEVGARINLVATLERSTFRNFPELRLRIIDVI